jgi:tripartite-type tricarboxylate transporter receptor subunit TctC
MIVPWPPSGAVDILARPIGQRLSENLAQPIVIDNRPGTNGIIASEAVAKAPADGYTSFKPPTGLVPWPPPQHHPTSLRS